MPDPTARRAAGLAALIAAPVALLAGVLVFWLLGGFGGASPEPSGSPTPAGPQPTTPVSMPAPALSAGATIACRALLSQLPDSVREAKRRPVTAGAEQNAAYGEPPVRVACGVPAVRYPLDDQVYVISGTCYHPAERDDATVWTTVDREVPVAITVPKALGQAAEWLSPLSTIIAGSVRSLPKPPFGCAHG